ncbi:MAG: lipoyl(octanoyl) transferase LipB [Actinomycetota bacterium]|nr:lipoyl(octanoyl) transferase LipB [Actinomycetota bacterium]
MTLMQQQPDRPDAIAATWLGGVDYGTAWAAQAELFDARRVGAVGDRLLLLEHPPTYTLGRRTSRADLLYDDAARAARSISLYEVDRGGRATYHGPGQLVGYPIISLGERYDVIAYVRKLEEVLIRTAADLGVDAHRDRHTGVWVGNDKLAAIGVKITRGITMHGFALNVTTDLAMFAGIVPCGLSDRGVTSVEAVTGRSHSVRTAARIAAHHAGIIFGRSVVWTAPQDVGAPSLGPASLKSSTIA